MRCYPTIRSQPQYREVVTLRTGAPTVTSVAFSPTGLLAAGLGDKVMIWNKSLVDPIIIPTTKGANLVFSVAFGSSEELFVGLMNYLVVAHQAGSTQPRSIQRIPVGNDFDVKSIAFSPFNGAVAIGLDSFTRGGRVLVWDNNENPERIYTGLRVTSVAFSPRGSLAAGLLDGNVVLWDLAGNERVLDTEGSGVYSVAFNSDGYLAAGLGMGLRVWDPMGNLVRTMKSMDQVISVAFSSSGALAVGMRSGKVGVYNLGQEWKPQKVRALDTGTSYVTSVAFDKEESLATANADGTVMIWQPAST